MHPSRAHILFLPFLPGAETSADLAPEPGRKSGWPRPGGLWCRAAASARVGCTCRPGARPCVPGAPAPGFLTTPGLTTATQAPQGCSPSGGVQGGGLVPEATSSSALGVPAMGQVPGQSAPQQPGVPLGWGSTPQRARGGPGRGGNPGLPCAPITAAPKPGCQGEQASQTPAGTGTPSPMPSGARADHTPSLVASRGNSGAAQTTAQHSRFLETLL